MFRSVGGPQLLSQARRPKWANVAGEKRLATKGVTHAPTQTTRGQKQESNPPIRAAADTVDRRCALGELGKAWETPGQIESMPQELLCKEQGRKTRRLGCFNFGQPLTWSEL